MMRFRELGCNTVMRIPVVVLLFIVSCSTPQDVGTVVPQDVIAGAVTAPEGQDVKGAELYLCPVDGSECQSAIIDDSGTRGEFRFEDVVPGEYHLTAFKSVAEDRFLAGCHGAFREVMCEPSRISPPDLRANINLVLVEMPALPAPPPPPTQ